MILPLDRGSSFAPGAERHRGYPPPFFLRRQHNLVALMQAAMRGYSIYDLTVLFGASSAEVRQWLSAGLFGRHHCGIEWPVVPEADVCSFIRHHADDQILERARQVAFGIKGDLKIHGD